MKKNYIKINLLRFTEKPMKTVYFFLILFLISSPAFIHSQQSYTFTNAGATGSVGPTQGQINAAYAATNLSVVVATGGIQSFTIPSSGLYAIDITAASGGNAPSYNKVGGLGARMKGEFILNAGQVLQVLVGQRGTDGCGNGSGGGGTYVVCNGTLLIAAGGGGGCTSDQNAVSGTTLTSGTADSPSVSLGGTNGSGGSTCTQGTHNGGGGGGYVSGVLGNGVSSSGGGGFSFLNGGLGGAAFFNTQAGPAGGFGGGGGGSYCTVGGGGGGGYSGGAGGQHLNQCLGNSARTGGGGGGSFNSGTNQVNVSGANSGHGSVTLTPLCNISLNSASSTTICVGSSITLTTNAVSGITWNTGSTNSSIVVSPTVTQSYSVVGTSSANCATSAAILVTVHNPTINAASSSNSVCLNGTVTLTGSGANTYTWTGGVTNGVPFAPAVTNNYTLTGTGACGTYTTVRTITVGPLPVVAISSPSVVCAGNISNLSAGGATTYTWLPGNMTGATVAVSPQITTIYTITGSSGVCGGVSTLTVTANPNPTITTSASSSVICGGTTVTLTASGASTYTWQSGPTNGPVLVVTPTVPAAYPVSGTNSFGCTTNTSQVVIANPSPIITVLASNSQICLGGSSTLTASGGSNYLWNTGSTNAVEVVNPIVSSVYTVTSVNPNSNCVGTQTVSVDVFTQTLSVSNATAICMGNSVTLNASGATTYSWSNGSNASSIFVFPTTSTVYSVSATTATNNMNCESSGTVAVTVNPNPTVTAVVTKTVICKGETTTITATGATTYSWNTAATTSVISISPTANTNYTVTGTNANGCVNTITVQARVSSCTGIETLNGKMQNLISIYPNPSNGEFNIKSDVAINLSLINELGQTIRVANLSELNNYQVTISDLASGIYFVVGNKDDLKVNQKIVVAK